VVKGSTLLPTSEPAEPTYASEAPMEASHRRTMSGVRSSVVEYDHSNHSSERREQWLRNRLSWLRAGVYKMLIAKPSLLEKAGAAMVMRISGSAEQVFRAFDNVRDRGGWVGAVGGGGVVGGGGGGVVGGGVVELKLWFCCGCCCRCGCCCSCYCA
jgi:hypothetical protein